MASRNNARFAQIVAETFSALGVTQEFFHDQMGGPSDSTLRKIMDAEDVGISPLTLTNLDTAFSWQPGSAAQTLRGGNPTPIGNARPSAASLAITGGQPAVRVEPSDLSFYERLDVEARAVRGLGDRLLSAIDSAGLDVPPQSLAMALANLSTDYADALVSFVEKHPELRARFAEGYTAAMLAVRHFLQVRDRFVPENERMAEMYTDVMRKGFGFFPGDVPSKSEFGLVARTEDLPKEDDPE